MSDSRGRRLLRFLPVLLPVLLFATHRVLVILSAGDFLYPLEPSEAKNTQIAWDLVSGRFGTDGFGFGSYIANSGSIHHASYSSGAFAYWLVSRFFGFGALSVRLVPLLAWVGALLIWGEVLRRRLGGVAATLGLLGLTLVPTLFIGFQLSFLGCHPESVLPLALLIGSWLLWLEGPVGTGAASNPDAAPAPKQRRRLNVLLGACLGYATAFSYLLWPFVALAAALTLVPPLPRPSKGDLKQLAIGVTLGLWPIWLIFLLEGPGALVGSSITEREETTMWNMARGVGLDWELYLRTLRENLPSDFHDYWMGQGEAGALWGGQNFERWAYHLFVYGPLALLPWAATERDPGARRLGLLVAIAPTACFLWLCFASPWKPHVPARYFIPFAFLGMAAPGVAVGLGLRRLRQVGASKANKLGGAFLALLGALLLAWLAPPRIIEAADAVRLERAPGVLAHRYVTYYNLGIGTVWAAQVDDVNDLLDVRAAQGDPAGYDGMQAGLWGAGRRLALGDGDWDPPDLTWGSLRSGLKEWGERQGYLDPTDQDDRRQVARNVGWGAGIRALWQVQLVSDALQEAQDEGEWRDDLPLREVWYGFGFGWGRAVADVPAQRDSLPDSVPEPWRDAVVEGMKAGRALGPVPKAPRKPIFESVRGPAT